MVQAVDADEQLRAAQKATGKSEPSQEEIAAATKKLIDEAAKPIDNNSELRKRIVAIKRSYEQIIDKISQDAVQSAGYSQDARQKAESLVKNFEQFIAKNKDEITALQILYSRPYKQRLTYDEVKKLAQAIEKPEDGLRATTPEQLWRAYETLDKSKVRGSGGRVLTDLVSLVRFATPQENELHPFAENVNARFGKWLNQHKAAGDNFTTEQVQWLEAIRDHVAANVAIELDDFEYVPFNQFGGLGRAYQLFGDKLQPMLNELNEVLVA